MGLGIGKDQMGVITVNKSALIEAIKKNKEKHRNDFEEALVGYRKKAIEELTKILLDAKEDREIQSFHMSPPEDHTEDYTRVILMLEMCTEDKIFVTEADFAKYVQDDWQWKHQFVAATEMYSGKGKR